MFARSTDGGLTFSAPQRINDDPMNQNKWHWFGTLAVAPNGRIDSVWLDTRNAANNTDSQLFYSYSTDGGVTWSPNVAVSILSILSWLSGPRTRWVITLRLFQTTLEVTLPTPQHLISTRPAVSTNKTSIMCESLRPVGGGNAYADTYGFSNTDCDSYGYSDRNGYFYADANRYRYCYRDSYGDSNSNSYSNNYCYSQADAHPAS